MENKLNEELLLERTRQSLNVQNKSGADYAGDQSKGRNRFERKKYSSLSKSVRAYNQMDMNNLFKNDILTLTLEVHGETDNYKVKVKFGGIINELQKEIKRNNNKIDYKCVHYALHRVFNSEDVYVNCTCLHPDTRINLLDGSIPTVAEMKKRFDTGEKLYVYSTDAKGDFKPGEVEGVWVTGETKEFIKVTLDNDEEILTTPDHLYMLRDGSYIEASELKEGQSLMPMYLANTREEYDTVKLNTTGKYHSIYKLVADYFYKNLIEELKANYKEEDNMPYKVAIHHVDFDKHNNNPENLQPMNSRDHWKYHADIMGEKWSKEDFRDKMMSMFKSPEFSESMKHRFDSYSKEQMEDLRRKDSIGNKGKHCTTEESRKSQSERMKNNIINYWKNISPEEREIQSNRRRNGVKKYWKNNTPSKAFHEAAVKRGEYLNRNDVKEKCNRAIKDYWNSCSEEEYVARKNQYKEARTLGNIKKLISLKMDLTAENFNRVKGRCISKITQEYLDDLVSKYELNHKVKRIEFVEMDTTPTYDIKVKDYHNFRVGAGVILHNCPDFFYTFLHHADKGGYSSINQDPGPGMGIRNPNNDKGAGCKHTALVLSKIDWLLKVSSTLSNYIHYMEEHQERLYAKLMFPKLYGMSYDKAVQLDLFDNGRDYLKHSKQELDKSNEEGKDRGKFQKGNTSGMRFSKSTGEVEDENQLELDLDNNTESEE